MPPLTLSGSEKLWPCTACGTAPWLMLIAETTCTVNERVACSPASSPSVTTKLALPGCGVPASSAVAPCAVSVTPEGSAPPLTLHV